MRQLLGFGMVLGALGLSAWGILREVNREQALPDAKAFTYAAYHLNAASERLGEMHGILGSYDGIPHDLIVGMTIAYASGGRYCIQLMREGHVYHRGGPGGSAQRGPCV
jgi:hypothetical protein